MAPDPLRDRHQLRLKGEQPHSPNRMLGRAASRSTTEVMTVRMAGGAYSLMKIAMAMPRGAATSTARTASIIVPSIRPKAPTLPAAGRQ